MVEVRCLPQVAAEGLVDSQGSGFETCESERRLRIVAELLLQSNEKDTLRKYLERNEMTRTRKEEMLNKHRLPVF